MSLELFYKFKATFPSEGDPLSPKQVALLFELEASLIEDKDAWEKMSEDNKTFQQEISDLDELVKSLKIQVEHKGATIEELEDQIKSAQADNLYDQQKHEISEALRWNLTLEQLEEIKVHYLNTPYVEVLPIY